MRTRAPGRVVFATKSCAARRCARTRKSRSAGGPSTGRSRPLCPAPSPTHCTAGRGCGPERYQRVSSRKPHFRGIPGQAEGKGTWVRIHALSRFRGVRPGPAGGPARSPQLRERATSIRLVELGREPEDAGCRATPRGACEERRIADGVRALQQALAAKLESSAPSTRSPWPPAPSRGDADTSLSLLQAVERPRSDRPRSRRQRIAGPP